MEEPKPTEQEVALEWFVRLRDPALSDGERAAFEAWLRADPRHAEAYREAEELWVALDQLEAPPQPAQDSPRTPLLHRAAPSPGARRPLRRLAQAAAAAAVLLVAVAAGYAVTAPGPVSGLLADYRTSVGERASHRLADGSQIELDAASALSVDFTPQERRVTLHGGVAFFQVAGDKARPFVVQTGLGQIEVLGTAFGVKAADDVVEVTVAENRVAVTHATGARAELGAGQSLRLRRDSLGGIVPADLDQALAWRQGRLVFRDTPLGEVVDMLERYRPGRIEIMDASLRELRVTASFAAGADDKALEAIEAAFPVELMRLTDYLVLIFPRERG